MRFWLVSLLINLFIIFFISINVPAENISGLEKESQLLESELKLAKTPYIYFILDLQNKVIFIKSRGMTLREIKIEDMRFWGNPVNTKPHILLKKSSLFKPSREEIEPKNAKETKETEKFEIKALELSDMPTSYRLRFDEGIVISIRPKANGVISTLHNALRRFNWYLSRPILTLWNYLRKKPFTAIYITLEKEGARSLHWSFTEGSESIIYNPS